MRDYAEFDKLRNNLVMKRINKRHRAILIGYSTIFGLSLVFWAIVIWLVVRYL